MFDVGAIARDLQTEFGLFQRAGAPPEPNSATPQHLRELAARLDVLTEALFRERLTSSSLVTSNIGEAQWDAAWLAWRSRLDAYVDALDGVADDDHQAVLWSVTAPLLLGFFGGEQGTAPRRPMDAVTPFSLANQLNVTQEWREIQLDAFVQDLKDNARDIVGGIGTTALVVVGVGVGLLLLAKGRR